MSYIPVISPSDIAKVKYALKNAVGEENRMSVEMLTEKIYGVYTMTNRRKVRAIVHEINCDKSDPAIVLTDTSDGGFWLAGSDPEAAIEHYNSEQSRAMALLEKAAAIKAKAENKYGRRVFAATLDKVKHKQADPAQPGLF